MKFFYLIFVIYVVQAEYFDKSAKHKRQVKIRTTALWTISTTNWSFPHFSPCETGGRKVREISICCRNCSQGSCSCFDFPLARSPKLRSRSQSRYSSKIEIPFLKRSEIPIAIVTSKSAIVCAPKFLPMKLALSYLELSKLFFCKR